jgi:signal recognition particle receptor subunit beta
VVTSIDINESQLSLTFKGAEEPTHVHFVDVPGHLHFKKELNDKVDAAKSVIFVLDSKDKASQKDGAEILYDLINNLNFLSEEIPLLIVANK